jgi:RimJ/RimL family protein N-acetyltransferase
MRLLERLRGEFRERGAKGFTQFLYGRLICRTWHSLLYEEPVEIERKPSEWPPEYHYSYYSPFCNIPTNIHRALSECGARNTLLSSTANDEIYVVMRGQSVASYGLVQFRSPQLSVLGLPQNVILIGNCVTLPDHRNRGLYRLALNETARRLRSRHFTGIFIEVHPSNLSSISGIARAGFRKIGAVEATIWFNTFVYRQGKWSRFRKS